MREFFVKLNSVSDIRTFVAQAAMEPFEIYAQTGSQKVSAQSFLGMISLDYRELVQITAECGEENWAEFGKKVERFRVER